MCVIALAVNKRPTLDILLKCENANKDGAGIMWFENKKALYKKNLTAKEVFELIQDEKKIRLPFCVHFRLASSGGKNPLLNHPFVVSKDSPLALSGEADKLLMHNGHIQSYDDYLAAAGLDPKEEVMSDSRAIAMILGSHNGNDRFIRKIHGYFVLADASIEDFIYYGNFDKEDGILYSNLFWKHSTVNCGVGFSRGYPMSSNEYVSTWQDDKSKNKPLTYHEYNKLKNKDSKETKITHGVLPVIINNLFSKKLSKRERKARRRWWREQGKLEMEKSNLMPTFRAHEQPPESNFLPSPIEKKKGEDNATLANAWQWM